MGALFLKSLILFKMVWILFGDSLLNICYFEIYFLINIKNLKLFMNKKTTPNKKKTAVFFPNKYLTKFLKFKVCSKPKKIPDP